MTKDAQDSGFGVEKTKSVFGFAEGLSSELDQLGFPDGSKRTAALAAAANLDRTQVYRLFKAEGGPSLSTLLSLRSVGVSIDRILDSIRGTHGVGIRLNVENTIVNATVHASQTQDCPVVLVPDLSGNYELKALDIWEVPPPESVSVNCISFPFLKKIAIVDDDKDVLALLRDELSGHFRVGIFDQSKTLLGMGEKIKSFDIFMIDWRLPDIEGESFITAIRERSAAPIFIFTGDTSASDSIARSLDLPDVHHVSKPASISILIKRLNQSMARKSSLN
ncbi:response regulator [Rhodoferax antarcticus]|nr:response regulator [Rhodoferax antarcticus]